MSGNYGETLFEPQDPGERERIDFGSLTYDPMTRSRLLALGVNERSRCLDVGAGTGTVSRWLAEDVRVAEVMAVDRDIRFLPADATGRLRVIAADVTSPEFEPGQFDLVHARFLLMHLRESRRIIAKLAGLLAPGGWLVLSDAIDLTTEQASESAYRSTMLAMWEGLRDSIGTDITWMPRYPERLAEAGLLRVGAEVHIPPLVPGAPITSFWLDTWARSRGAMLATGLVDDRQMDEAIQALSSPSFAGLSPGMITTWGQRA